LNVSKLYTNGATGCGCANFGGSPKFIINWTNPTQPITVDSGVWAVQVDPATCTVIAMEPCQTIAPPSPFLFRNVNNSPTISMTFSQFNIAGINTMTATTYWGDVPDNATPTLSTWSGTLGGTLNYTYPVPVSYVGGV
jgi:hypothetical protein